MALMQDAAFAADQFRLEGQVGLPHGGRVKKKVQMMNFENTAAPLRSGVSSLGADMSGSFTTGSPGGAGQVRTRDTYEYVEMTPLVFLQLVGNSRHCVMADASKGRFEIEDLSPGTYKLTFAIPDLGYMKKMVRIASDSVDSEGRVKLEFDFEPMGAVIEPVEREKISEKAASAFEKGSREFSKGNGENAFREFEKAVKEDDHYAEAWEYMGRIQVSKKNLEDAEKYFRKSLEIDPNSCRALEYQGTILLLKGDFTGARDLYEKAILIRPDDPLPRAQLGKALYQMLELSLALDHLVKARTIDPGHFSQPQILTAEIFRILGDREYVVAELNDFLKNFPDDPKVPAIKEVIASVP